MKFSVLLDLFKKKYKGKTDHWLLENWVNTNDDDMYCELRNRYAQRVFSFLRIRANNDDLAEDIVQHCFTALVLYPKSFMDKENIFSYICQVGIYELIRVGTKQSSLSSLDSLLEEGFDLIEDNNIIENIIWDDYKKDLLEIISELKIEHREICHLYFFEKQKPREISEILGISVKKVTNTIYKAQQYAAKRLIEKYGKDLHIMKETYDQ